ncbi:MAG: MFS transporter [Myxococcales bacterium]|nr:MFS transporter [Myxococcales bacterium]
MAAAPVASEAPSPAYARYVLGVLFVVYIFNFIDRQILSILLEPIKEELQVSDTAMGFLTGFAFAAFYTVAGLPIARLADKGTRRTIIAVGLAVWSAMTAAQGLTRVFWQLAIARVGVGVGEAACSPPAHSLIADYFPPERRATALAIYASGIHFGVLFGLLAGGWINEFFGWRVAFFVVGLPGILLAVLVRLTVREPERGQSEPGSQVKQEPPPIGEVFEFLRRLPAFRHLAVASAFMAFAGYGLSTWTPAFLVRVHGMGTGEIGTWYGTITGVFGASGAFLGGWLTDRLGRTDARWYLWVPAIGAVIGIPFVFGLLFWPDPHQALLLSIPSTVAGAMWLGPIFSMTQTLAHVRMRAVASAILLFVINIIGLGLGPQVVGILNDVLEPRFGVDAVRWSLASVVVVMSLWAGFHYLWAARTLREDLRAKDA